MTLGSLFDGISGFPLAASWAGIETKWISEIDPYCLKLSKKNFPNAIQYGDIKEIGGGRKWQPESVDIISGGFPCQPYSLAGKRKGKEDDRHLWPEMLRVIRELRPSWVVGENVLGIIDWNGGMVFNEVQADLEAEGYEVFTYVLPACGVNAPHKRDRVWIVAYSHNNRYRINRRKNGKKDSIQGNSWKEIQSGLFNGTTSIPGFNSNANSEGLQGSKIKRGSSGSGKNREKQLTGFLQPDWKEFPAQSPICGRDDGISNRMDRIKALGNAIVPQVAFEIFKVIKQIDSK